MANAFKCDRCGKLFESYEHHDRITQLIFRSKTVSGNPLDLCCECSRDFLIWWEHSNVSAARDFYLVQSEMNAQSLASENHSTWTIVNNLEQND